MKSTSVAIFLVGTLLLFTLTPSDAASGVPAGHSAVSHCDNFCRQGGSIATCCAGSGNGYKTGVCRNKKAYCTKQGRSG